MHAILVSAVLQALLLVADVQSHRYRGLICKQKGFKDHCGPARPCDKCIRQPKGICDYAGLGRCPSKLCVPDFESDPCAHGACPYGQRCTAGPPGGRGGFTDYKCATKAYGHRCGGGELCLPDAHGSGHCVPPVNDRGAIFDGRNAEGKYVPCKTHVDCYEYREPVEWHCCQDKRNFGHSWSRDPARGAYCDEMSAACVIERYEFGKLRWTLAVPRGPINAMRWADCKKACPCC